MGCVPISEEEIVRGAVKVYVHLVESDGITVSETDQELFYKALHSLWKYEANKADTASLAKAQLAASLISELMLQAKILTDIAKVSCTEFDRALAEKAVLFLSTHNRGYSLVLRSQIRECRMA